MIQEREGNADAEGMGKIIAGAKPNEEERHCTSGGKGLREKQKSCSTKGSTIDTPEAEPCLDVMVGEKVFLDASIFSHKIRLLAKSGGIGSVEVLMREENM